MINFLGNLLEDLFLMAGVFLLSVICAGLRIYGITNASYQAFAHMLVILLIAAAWRECRWWGETWPLRRLWYCGGLYGYLAAGLCIVEIAMALYTHLPKLL